MKPCSNNVKLIAWLALDALDARQEHALRAHLKICAGCRHHLEEISNLTEKLAAAEIRSDIQTSASFHQKVAGALRAEAAGSAWETTLAKFPAAVLIWLKRTARLFSPSGSAEAMNRYSAIRAAETRRRPPVRNLRDASRSELTAVRMVTRRFMSGLGLPLLGATVVVVVVLSVLLRRQDVPLPAPSGVQAVLMPEKTDLAPTFSNYQMLVNRSLEKLDQVLTAQENRNPSSTPIYTASTLSRASALE